MRRIGMGGLFRESEDLDYLVKLAESELNFAKENLKFCRQMLTAMKISVVFIVIWVFLIIASFFVFDNTLLTYILKVVGMVLTPFFFIKGFKKVQIDYNNAIRNVNNASDKLAYLRCLNIK